jgi:hypothetical protein
MHQLEFGSTQLRSCSFIWSVRARSVQIKSLTQQLADAKLGNVFGGGEVRFRCPLSAA